MGGAVSESLFSVENEDKNSTHSRGSDEERRYGKGETEEDMLGDRHPRTQ